MLINLQNKFVFIHIPKTAGTFIKNNLYYMIPNSIVTNDRSHVLDAHSGISDFKQYIDKNIDSYFKFTCIRNPLSWYVSLYHFHKQTHSWGYLAYRGKDTGFKEWIINFLEFNGNIDILDQRLNLRIPNKDLWLNYKLLVEGFKLDVGFLSHLFIYGCFLNWEELFQRDFNYLKENYDSIAMDKIITPKEINILHELIDLGYPFNLSKLPRTNESKHKNYLEYYDEETIQLVKKKDRILYEHFDF